MRQRVTEQFPRHTPGQVSPEGTCGNAHLSGQSCPQVTAGRYVTDFKGVCVCMATHAVCVLEQITMVNV